MIIRYVYENEKLIRNKTPGNYRTRFGSMSFSLITAQLVKESSSVGHFVAVSCSAVVDILSKNRKHVKAALV